MQRLLESNRASLKHNYLRNEGAHQVFLDLIEQLHQGPISNKLRTQLNAFKVECRSLHNKQWSEHIYNIISTTAQCPNNCRYCYMKTIKTRFFHAPAIEDAPDDALLHTARVAKKWIRVGSDTQSKLIMFPSSHDIVPAILPQYIEVALKILRVGHDLLIVTKPRMDCMTAIADALEEFRERVIYRLTITTDQPAVLAFWERSDATPIPRNAPNAPSFAERLASLQMLHARGCITSVSMEPFLSDPRPIVAIVAPFVSETIWIGPMSGLTATLAGSDAELARLRALYDPEYLANLARDLHANAAFGAKIRWKAKVMTQIIEVLESAQGAE